MNLIHMREWYVKKMEFLHIADDIELLPPKMKPVESYPTYSEQTLDSYWTKNLDRIYYTAWFTTVSSYPWLHKTMQAKGRNISSLTVSQSIYKFINTGDEVSWQLKLNSGYERAKLCSTQINSKVHKLLCCSSKY